jgi:Ca-activated chloride channel family protein
MFRFAAPAYFLLIPLVALAAYRLLRRRRAPATRFGAGARIPHRRTWRMRLVGLVPWLFLLGLIGTLIALSRPQTVLDESRRTAHAIGMMMVVDVSGSMEALDLSPKGATAANARTRLDVVKETFDEFIERRQDDLIGLISFGGYAATLVPLTSDHAVLRHVLDGVEVPSPRFDSGGELLNSDELSTAIGDGLATACARIRDSETVSKVIVLLSDGESNAGIITPQQAIEVAKALGVRVYTIGIGTTGTAPFRISKGRSQRVVQQAVAIDEALLGKIADETGGRYYNVRDPRGLDAAMESIGELEKTEVTRQIYSQYREWFALVLAPSLVFVFLAAMSSMILLKRPI